MFLLLCFDLFSTGEAAAAPARSKNPGAARKANPVTKAKAVTAAAAVAAARSHKYLSYSGPELKALLRANDQHVSGSRGELLERVIERSTNGALPKCPRCYGGKLHLAGKHLMECKGFHDGDRLVYCAWAGTVPRLPWRDEKLEHYTSNAAQ